MISEKFGPELPFPAKIGEGGGADLTPAVLRVEFFFVEKRTETDGNREKRPFPVVSWPFPGIFGGGGQI